jgi:hypothetical protein
LTPVGVKGFNMEQRGEIKCCLKLKKTAPEMFEMLKSPHSAEYLSRTTVFEWRKLFTVAQKVRVKNCR